jgi:hypothetical protein
MTWKRFWHKHDWQIVESFSIEQLEHILRGGSGRIISDCGYSYVQKKVCLRCGDVVDEITPERERILRDDLREKERK